LIRPFKILLSFAVGFALTILFLEVFLKVTEIKLPFKTLDTTIGKTYRADVPIHENKEGFYMGQTNAYGFVGKTTLKKKPNVFRIAVFGDSFTEAFQLSEKYNFTKILEQKLKSKSAIEVEVLNFGMSNAVLSEMYIRKEKLAKQFDIDLFVYFFDSYDFVALPQGVINSVSLVDKNGSIQIEKSTATGYHYYKKMQPLIDNSSYINLFLDGFILYRNNQLKPILFDKFYKEAEITADYSYYDYYLEHLTPENKKILAEMEKEPTVFVFRENAETKLKQSLKQFNILIIETKPVLDTLRKQGIDPYYWELPKTSGHFNYEANRAIGIFLADRLVSRIVHQ